MKQLGIPYQLTEAPDELKNVHLDNIAIVPASMLNEYTNVKKRIPNGSVLILSPPISHIIYTRNLQKVLTNVASYFRSRGRAVTTIQASRLAI
jgi:hypothetical protein